LNDGSVEYNREFTELGSSSYSDGTYTYEYTVSDIPVQQPDIVENVVYKFTKSNPDCDIIKLSAGENTPAGKIISSGVHAGKTGDEILDELIPDNNLDETLEYDDIEAIVDGDEAKLILRKGAGAFDDIIAQYSDNLKKLITDIKEVDGIEMFIENNNVVIKQHDNILASVVKEDEYYILSISQEALIKEGDKISTYVDYSYNFVEVVGKTDGEYAEIIKGFYMNDYVTHVKVCVDENDIIKFNVPELMYGNDLDFITYHYVDEITDTD
ncbi:unnamed protein product, partial [marine sediment metagenome]